MTEYRKPTEKELYYDLQKVVEYLGKFRGIEAEKARAGYMMSIVINARDLLKP